MTGIQIGRFRFAPRLMATLFALLFCAVTVSLGHWQTRRAEEKAGLQQRLDNYAAEPAMVLGPDLVAAGDVVDRRVSARGMFEPERTLYIDNRLHGGVPGYHVVTPLRIAGSDMHVLVNRGWVAVGASRGKLPDVKTNRGGVTVEGVAVVPLAHPYELKPDTAVGALRQNLVLDRVSAETRLVLQPFVLLQTSRSDDGLVRDWPKPDAGVATHRAYALQWYAMAAMAFLLWAFLSLKKGAT